MGWEGVIINTISALGGIAGLQELYGSLPKFIRLTPKHLRRTDYGGRPAFQHQVRSHVSNLCQKGELIKVGTGRYQLTKKGSDRLLISDK